MAGKGYAVHSRYIVLDNRSGGLGDIYICQDRETGELTVLKTLKSGRSESVRQWDYFLQEAALWLFLGRHPHMASARRIEYFPSTRMPFLVLEWVGSDDYQRDSSLGAHLAKGRPLPIGRSLLYIRQIVGAMKFAERKVPGLVHHDIKPANILVGRDGSAKLTDFGLARSYQGLQHDPSTQDDEYHDIDLPGSAPYRAPEQWQPGAVLDRRVDIYSLGCTLFELVTACQAVPGTDSYSLWLNHQQNKLTPIPVELPRQVADIITCATSRLPEYRYATWAEFEAALDVACRQFAGSSPAHYAEESQIHDLPQASPGTIDGYRSIGSSYHGLGQLETAKIFFQHALVLAQQGSDDSTLCRLYHDLGIVHGGLCQFDTATNHLDQAITLAERTGDSQHYRELYALKGGLMIQSGKLDSAELLLRESVQWAVEAGDITSHTIATGNLGTLYGMREDHSAALKWFKRTLEMCELAGDESGQMQALENIGHALYKAGLYEQSVCEFEKLFTLANQGKAIAFQLLALKMIAFISFEHNQKLRAVSACRNYLEIADRSSSDSRFIASLLARAETL